MKLPGYMIVIICCLGFSMSNVSKKRYLLSTATFTARIPILVGQGVLLLVYPLLGHLADVYLTRYRALKASLVILTIVCLLAIIYESIDITASLFGKINVFHQMYLGVVMTAIFIMYIIGLGLYEANIIQFGLDQLLEAPTPKLIAFIHWYYWAHYVGELVLYYESSGATFANLYYDNKSLLIDTFLEGSQMVLLIILNTTVLIILCISKKLFYLQNVGLNPFKNIYKVLKYSWKHKVPERRSAFTYWEEDIPRRIDLGKNKYGGPFTNEEVEDTKTFLRILPLLLCLFGYHLAGDGYSPQLQLQRTSCPSLPVLLLIVANPQHLTALVTVVGIPLYRLVIMKIIPNLKSVRMLTKMWVGLYLSMLQVVIYIIIVINSDVPHWPQEHTNVDKIYTHLPSRQCLRNQVGYRSISMPLSNTYLWFIIPQLLNGLSSLLVSMTVFEFICAQAPRTTQGLFIGLWYATFSIRYLVVGILDNLIIERRSWLICEGVKGFLILVSLVLFSCVSRRYRYRQRDEIVNVQAMIEDTHERWFNQEEEYMQERKAFFANPSTYSATL